MTKLSAFWKIELILVATILLAAFLRTYRLNEFPPALYWDEAFDGVDAWHIVENRAIPFFFPGNTGREPLMMYFQAIGLSLLGMQEWSLRLVSALVGIVSIPILYRTSAAMYSGETRAKMLGALAAAMLATSFWHVDLSRLTMRAISYPLFSMMTVYFFWRAWQKGRLADFAFWGSSLGLTLYTYLAARLFPVVFVGFVLLAGGLAFVRRSPWPGIGWRQLGIGLGVMLIALVVVCLPLGIYFLVNPSIFFLRTNYISIFSGDARGWASLPYNVLTTFRMFIDRGDVGTHRNLAGQPALNLLATLGFGIGLILAALRWIRQPRYIFLLLWFIVNLIPSFFSVDIPNSMRVCGALAPTLILAADGMTWAWERLVPKLSLSLLCFSVITFSGALVFNDYINRWGPRQITYVDFDGNKRMLAERAIALSQTSDVVVPLGLYITPNAQFYLATRFAPAQPLHTPSHSRPAAWLAADAIERAVVVLHPDGSVSVPQPLNDAQVSRLNQLMANSQPLTNPFGQIVGHEIAIDDAADFLLPLKPSHPLNATFSGKVKLLGYDMPSTLAPGSHAHITYYWQALAHGEFDYLVLSTLLDSHGQVSARRFAEPAAGPMSLWQRGQVTVDSFEIVMPASLHPGTYRIELALIEPSSPDHPLALSTTDDRLLLDPFVVSSQAIDLAAIQHPLGLKLGNPTTLSLVGYDLDRTTWKPGDTLPVTLYWKSEHTTPVDYSVFLHLLDADGNMVAQQDRAPQHGNAPTSWWMPGNIIADTHELAIPDALSAGRYTLAIGIYNSADGIRLPMFDTTSKRQTDDAWQLPIEITEP